MKKHFGTRFNFKNVQDGERMKIWTDNGVTFFREMPVPIMDPETLEDTGETELAPVPIPYEILMDRFRPTDPIGVLFTEWCLKEIRKSLTNKIEVIDEYCASLK